MARVDTRALGTLETFDGDEKMRRYVTPHVYVLLMLNTGLGYLLDTFAIGQAAAVASATPPADVQAWSIQPLLFVGVVVQRIHADAGYQRRRGLDFLALVCFL